MSLFGGGSMQITDAMLEAALGKAVEAGLLSRRSVQVDALSNREVIRTILQAALAAASSDPAYRDRVSQHAVRDRPRDSRP